MSTIRWPPSAEVAQAAPARSRPSDAVDGRQRGAQLVADHGHELVLRPLDGLTLADVPDEAAEHRGLAGLDGPGRHLDRELPRGTVEHRHLEPLVARGSRTRLGAEPDAALERLPVLRRQDQVRERQADDLLPGQAEGPLRLRVPLGDSAVAVELDIGVAGRGHDASGPFLALAQRLRGGVPVGDVEDRAEHGRRLTVLVHDHLAAGVDHDLAAVRPDGSMGDVDSRVDALRGFGEDLLPVVRVQGRHPGVVGLLAVALLHAVQPVHARRPHHPSLESSHSQLPIPATPSAAASRRSFSLRSRSSAAASQVAHRARDVGVLLGGLGCRWWVTQAGICDAVAGLQGPLALPVAVPGQQRHVLGVDPRHLLGGEHVLDPVRRDVLRLAEPEQPPAGGFIQTNRRRSGRSGPRREMPRRSTRAGHAAPRAVRRSVSSARRSRRSRTVMTLPSPYAPLCTWRTTYSTGSGRRRRRAGASRRWPAAPCSTAAHRAQSAGPDPSGPTHVAQGLVVVSALQGSPRLSRPARTASG